MKRIILVSFLTLTGISLFSQPIRSDTVSAGNQVTGGFQPKKFNYGINLGTGFSTSPGYGSGLVSYITPHFTYGVNRKLLIGGGFSVSNTSYFNVRPWYASESRDGVSGSFQTATLFVNGTWLAGERLTVSGSAFKEFPLAGDALPYDPFNPYAPNSQFSRKGAQGFDFTVDYRIGKNVHIQAGFRYSDGIPPGYRNGLYGDPFVPVNRGYGGGMFPSW